MSTAAKKRLRDLVNDYYHGLLTFESYREKRAQLLDNIDSPLDLPDIDSIADDSTRVPAPDSTPTGEHAIERPGESARPQSRRKSGNTGLLIGAIAVAVAGLAIVLVVMRSPGTAPTADDAVPSATASTPGNPGESILGDFLDQNEWSQDSLANLLIAWNALDDRQREQTSGSRQYRRFTSRLHQRIREEAALNTGAPTGRLQMMTEFAAGFGAPYRASASISPAFDTQPPAAAANAADVDPGEPPAVTDVVIDDAFEDAVVDSSGDPPVATAETTAGVTAALLETAPEPAPEAATTVSDVPAAVDATPAADAAPAPVSDRAEAPEPAPAAAPSAPRQAPADDACPARLANTRQPYCRDQLGSGDDGPVLVVLRAGEFDMGSTDNDEESPVHRVAIGSPIAMSREEISVAEYRRYCNAAGVACPSTPWPGDDYPVVSVSWNEAVEFTLWLSEQTGHLYRLPTEAEWEYAARAGTTTPYSFGEEVTPSAAHSSANGPVDAPLPRSRNNEVNRNPFRLYHMSGNVREWVADSWYPDYTGAPADGSARTGGPDARRVVRGGSYADSAASLRSAAREAVDATHRDSETGFRVVREIYNADD